MSDESELYTLEDISVETVGIVGKGANDQIFFLLKSQEESSMADDLTIEDVDEVARRGQTPESPEAPKQAQDETLTKSEQGFLKQFISFLKSKVSKPNPQALAQAARILNSGGYDVSANDLAGMMDEMMDDEEDGEGDEEEMEMAGDKPGKKKPGGGKKTRTRKAETTAEGGQEPVSEETSVVTKSIEEQLAEIQKANEARLEAIEKALEEKYKGQVEVLQKQAEEAKTEVEKAVEARERREWLEKAGEMTFALGVNPKELADHLYAIGKAAPDHVEFIVSTLKAADHALTEAGLFNEFGTSREAEETSALEKAQKIANEKNIPLAEALLELPAAEQKELVKGMLGTRKEK